MTSTTSVSPDSSRRLAAAIHFANQHDLKDWPLALLLVLVVRCNPGVMNYMPLMSLQGYLGGRGTAKLADFKAIRAAVEELVKHEAIRYRRRLNGGRTWGPGTGLEIEVLLSDSDDELAWAFGLTCLKRVIWTNAELVGVTQKARLARLVAHAEGEGEQVSFAFSRGEAAKTACASTRRTCPRS